VAESTGTEIPVTLDGGVLYVWAEGEAASELAKALADAEGVAEVIGQDSPEAQARRAELHTRHPRTPPLIAVTASGYMFIESPLFMDYTRGSHGTADLDTDLLVPLVVYGPRARDGNAEQLFDAARSLTDIYGLVMTILGIE
jgi:hypothetical protein